MRILENSGVIDLASMAVISGTFLQCSKDKAKQECLTTNLAQLTYKRHVDDSHARFEQYYSLKVFLIF